MRYWGIIVKLAIFVVGTVFPAYKSVEALESQGVMDDSQWLTYWLLSAIITIVERFAGRFLFALPFFAEFKLAFLAWLVVPPFCGAAALYEVGRPHLVKVYSVLRQNADELKGSAARDDGTMTRLRERIASVKRNVHTTLQEMFTAVSLEEMEQSDLEEKLQKLEGIVGTASSKTGPTSSNTYATSGGGGGNSYTTGGGGNSYTTTGGGGGADYKTSGDDYATSGGGVNKYATSGGGGGANYNTSGGGGDDYLSGAAGGGGGASGYDTKPSATSGGANPVSSFGTGQTTDAPNLEADPGMRSVGAPGFGDAQAPPGFEAGAAGFGGFDADPGMRATGAPVAGQSGVGGQSGMGGQASWQT